MVLAKFQQNDPVLLFKRAVYAKLYAFAPEMSTILPFVQYKT